MNTPYPKRLIEVDLPIARISAHARREKSIRHGHISTLHIWWARRPLAACRAVICAALWPDPADPLCPDAFRETARKLMKTWAADQGKLQGAESFKRFLQGKQFPKLLDDNHRLRDALLDFIADFANWDNSTVPAYLETSRALTQAAHEALGGAPGTRPLVVDPFAGGGSIPLEALRVGADAFASDLNPVAVLLNKVVLEYIPKYGQRLADEVRKWGKWIKKEAEKELAEFYPKDADGATPIAYLWARTIQCEGPGCGAEVPLIRSLWLARKPNRSVALQHLPNRDAKRCDFQIIVKHHDAWVDQANPKTKIETPKFDGTLKRGSATCPFCGYTTPVARVREQLMARCGGANDARLLAVVTSRSTEQGRFYRSPMESDVEAVREAEKEVLNQQQASSESLSLVPDEELDVRGIRRVQVPNYGMKRFGHLFTSRQALGLTTLTRLVREYVHEGKNSLDRELTAATRTCLALAVGRQTDATSSLARWHVSGEKHAATFGRQALPIVWDFSEVSVLSNSTGGFPGALEWVIKVCEANGKSMMASGHVEKANATSNPLPDDSANAFITDPPYYDSITYSYLSDYFYVWLRRILANDFPTLFSDPLVPKDEEIIVDPPHRLSNSHKTLAFYERELSKAFGEGRRVLRPDGIGTIVFASKTTASWEAILIAVVDAGWIITGSWPIDTEMEARVAAQGQARLASSVHLVCRPRENPDGSLRDSEIGDWRDVLAELPRRIHEWMPRLAEEGVVGADAIFSCLGPALEIFSRYSRVEKSSGDVVPLREYLEHVWAAVSNEALSMIFRDADAAGLEPDARLTAMWLWTLGTASPTVNGSGPAEENADEESVEDEVEEAKQPAATGFVLEFDAARKIAQGLGIHLDKSPSIVEVKGDKARLLPVAERTKYLFGKEAVDAPTTKKKPKKKDTQLSLFEALQEVDADVITETSELKVPQAGSTVLDRVHQAMILFAAGRGEALKRFLVEEGIGKDARFWKLAQSLSALYPPGINEKRWVDGVLARKKSLGL